MNQRIIVRVGLALATFLGVDALLNLYWATGSVWQRQMLLRSRCRR